MWISNYIFAISYNEGYTATFLPPHPAPDNNVRTNYTFVAHEIALKWKLTSIDAPYLLEQQFYKINDYNPNTDFLHFDHIPKTGGTSISDLLRDTLGQSYILPGSERSGAFNYKVMNATILLSTPKEEYPYIVSYAHERLRPIHGQNRTKLAKLFENYFALPNNKAKRLRQLAVLREPMDLRASTHAMALCSINGRVNNFNSKRKKNGLEPICTPEQGLNISSLWGEVVEKAMEKCASNGTIATDMKADKYDRALCRRGRHAYDICRGSMELLASEHYRRGMRSLLRGIMGRYTAQQKLDKSVDHYYHRHTPIEDGYAVKDEHGQLRYTLEKIEEYVLIDLGGIDMNIMHTPYQGYEKRIRQLRSNSSEAIITSNNIVEPDFVWYGITERMDESMCLLYYTLNAKPLAQPPKERVMKCSPTSWWTAADRDKVKEMEPADYTVWRTANAILDIRVMKMKEDIKAKLKYEDNLTQKEIDLNRAFVDAGCLE